jgi:hypothetical protein
MFYGVLSETLMFIVIIYIPGINNAFGARPVDIFNLGYLKIFNFNFIIECQVFHSVFVYYYGRRLENI